MPRHRYQMPNVQKADGPRPYWYIRFRVDRLTTENTTRRVEERKMLGYCDEVGKRKAEQIRNEWMRTVNRSEYVLQSQIPFSKLLEAYRRVHLPTVRAESTRQTYESYIRKHIEPWFQDYRLMDVTTLECQKWVNHLASVLAYSTRRIVVAILHNMFEQADLWGYWESANPVRRINLGPKRGARDKRIPQMDQLRRLIAACDPQTALMVRMAVWTGMRISEIVGLHWRNVNLEHGIVCVTERYYRGELGPTKRDASNRDLPLGYLTDELRAWKRDAGPDDLVFQQDGGYVRADNLLDTQVKKAAAAMGFDKKGLGWHTFRRMHLTLFNERIADETRQQAGHSNAGMTAVYVQENFARREQTVRAMQEAMFAGAHTA